MNFSYWENILSNTLEMYFFPKAKTPHDKQAVLQLMFTLGQLAQALVFLESQVQCSEDLLRGFKKQLNQYVLDITTAQTDRILLEWTCTKPQF